MERSFLSWLNRNPQISSRRVRLDNYRCAHFFFRRPLFCKRRLGFKRVPYPKHPSDTSSCPGSRRALSPTFSLDKFR